MHALKYDVDAFWLCELCPKPLEAEEKQENFEAKEVHIYDGITHPTYCREGNIYYIVLHI